MKKRATDNGDTPDVEIKKQRKGLFAWVSLFLTNWTATKGILTVLTLALGVGTATNPAIYTKLVPRGQVVSDVNALEVTLMSMKAAIDANTASKAALVDEVRLMRQEMAKQRAEGDAQLRSEIEAIKKLVN